MISSRSSSLSRASPRNELAPRWREKEMTVRRVTATNREMILMHSDARRYQFSWAKVVSSKQGELKTPKWYRKWDRDFRPSNFHCKLMMVSLIGGGGGGIRTPGRLAPSTVFKTAAIDRSATPPRDQDLRRSVAGVNRRRGSRFRRDWSARAPGSGPVGRFRAAAR
jgi:hypothetical protein